jgi:hypothetical protein
MFIFSKPQISVIRSIARNILLFDDTGETRVLRAQRKGHALGSFGIDEGLCSLVLGLSVALFQHVSSRDVAGYCDCRQSQWILKDSDSFSKLAIWSKLIFVHLNR